MTSPAGCSAFIAGLVVRPLEAFHDERGVFMELFRDDHDHDHGHGHDHDHEHDHDHRGVRQVSHSASRAGTLRGLHASRYAKRVTVTSGRVFDVVVDLRRESSTFLRWHGVWLSAEASTDPAAPAMQQVVVPAGCAHGFFSPVDSCLTYVQGGTYDEAQDVNVRYNDPDIGVEWPPTMDTMDSNLTHGYIISHKDRNAPLWREIAGNDGVLGACAVTSADNAEDGAGPSESRHGAVDFLVIGASGFLGSHIVLALQEAGASFAACTDSSEVRLEDMSSIERALDLHAPRVSVICAAGTAGRPNIDWCETHQQETIMANVVGQLNVAEACRKRSLHTVLIGTGSLYTYDEGEHKMGSGACFHEDDPPNFAGNFYVRMRAQLETLLEAYSNVLNLRVVFPLTSTLHERSLVSKLIKYEKVVSVPTSFTCIDNLFPLIADLCRRGITGPLNFTNPGVTTNREILLLWKERVDPAHTWVDLEPQQQHAVSLPRAYSQLDTSRLESLFAAGTVLPIRDAVCAMIDKIAEDRSAASSKS